MNKAVRKAVIAGNWKMNKTRPEAKELIEAMKPMVAEAGLRGRRLRPLHQPGDRAGGRKGLQHQGGRAELPL